MSKRVLPVFVFLMFSCLVPWEGVAQSRGQTWQKLFNGTDLSGWVEVGEEKWEVTDGVIHGQGVTGEYGYLRTEKKYTDFQLFLRFKCLADGNSGVYFHADFTEGTVAVNQGRQFEIDRTVGRHTGGVYGDGRGWLAWPAAEFEPLIRSDDWNEMLMKVEGNRYICVLNGVQILDFTNPRPEAHDGYIALQLHSGKLGNMMFKDVYLLDLRK